MTRSKFLLALLMLIPLTSGIAQRESGAEAPSRTKPSSLSDLETERVEQEKKRQRLREGTEITDSEGSFEPAGDRLTYTSNDGEQEFRVLENLMMERVVQTMEHSRGKVNWIVSGKITEYRGNNYLILKHVILKGRK